MYRALRNQGFRVSFPLLLFVIYFLIVAPTPLAAQTVSGTVQDPSGAFIAGARVEITGGDLSEPMVLLSDGTGKFESVALKAGKYSVQVSKEGFDPSVQSVDLQGPLQLQFTLAIAKQNVNISVSGKGMAYANSDPVYRQLREIGLGPTFRVADFTLNCDVGTFHFQQGSLTMLTPVNGVVTGAIFVGEGHFSLKPVLPLDAQELERRSGAAELNEDFTDVVFRFTRDIRQNFARGFGERIEPAPQPAEVFKHWREKMRERREVPLGFSQALLQDERMDNVDADVLAAVLSPAHPAFINAYIRGKKHKDLRFFLRARVGGLPQVDSPEEVALINCDPEGLNDGIWYLAHVKSEYDNHRASSQEDRRIFATHRYKIETVIAKNGHLFSTATIAFEPLIEGERLLKFGLLPNLRVSRVTDEQGKDMYFVQESRKEDGSFYAILPQAPPVGKELSINVEYAGDKVLETAGEGSYYVKARTSWYPNLNGFGEHALYDLTFKVPKHHKVISIGKLQSESSEQDLELTHWVTPVPVAVAGFNYGRYEELDIPDEITNYKISGFYLPELPGDLRGYRALQAMSPRSMTQYALQQTRAELQICTLYFGKIPYDEIHITEQPNFSFGQSWPNLVYLPISAYTDSTQRWMLFGQINNKFTGFVQEVTPHEVAHQWWGHAVGWASYHDQWLSEGFAEFSAGLFLQMAVGANWRNDYLEFWERLRKRILEKNNFGIAPNDAGPIWMGLRLSSPRTDRAYQDVIYPKGAYVLEMLRSMMYSPEDGDKAFMEMMHDFVESHRDKPACSESFRAIVNKHITKLMDLQHNGRLDWFFHEWVYGTQIPRYKFEYKVTLADGGKFKLHLSVTQSEVDDQFAMLVPVHADFGKGMTRIGEVAVFGNSTRETDWLLPKEPKKVALNALKEVLER